MGEDIRERDVEQYLREEVRRAGGWALKFISPGCAGVPDRLLLFPGRVYFVEVKRPGEELRPLQKAVFRRLYLQYGLHLRVVSDRAAVDELIRDIRDTPAQRQGTLS